MGKITEQQLKDNIYKNTLETCEYISGYTGKSDADITLKCLVHDLYFQTKYENIRRANRAHYVCPYCQQDQRTKKYDKDRVELECAYCHAKFYRGKSKLINSQSGLYFCCREHKDLAQRINSGEEFSIIRPEHYGTGSSYREVAFREYPHVCSVCGYNEDERILQVHHRDSNRSNNSLNNLTILCPNCHWKITLGLYDLTDDNQLVEK